MTTLRWLAIPATLFFGAQVAYAQVTVTGGTITSSATAGLNQPGYTYQVSNPAPLSVAPSGTTTLTASAAGTALDNLNNTVPVSASATGTVTIQNSTIDLYSSSIATPVHAGPGVYNGVSSSNTDTLFFTLTQPETIGVNWTDPGPQGSDPNATGTVQTAGGTVLFTGFAPQTTTLNLAAGQYELTSQSSYGVGQFGDNTGNLAVTFPAPVPIPPAVWLFGSGLLMLVRFRRQH